MYKHTIHHRAGAALWIAACLSLLPLSAACQSKHSPCLKLAEEVQSPDAVHPGDSYFVTLRFEARGCVLTMTPLATPSQASWKSEPVGGLQADELSFWGRPLPDDPSHSRELSLMVKVTVSPEANAGKHTIPGILRYQALGPAGVSEEQLMLAIPVKVSPAQMTPMDEDLNWYQILLLIVTFPIAFFIYAANEC